jgi:hypothetical protein
MVLSILVSNAQLYCTWFLPMTGLVASFNMEVGITGAILTKLDGDSRGGAALSVKEVVNNRYAQSALYRLPFSSVIQDFLFSLSVQKVFVLIFSIFLY